MEKFNAHVETNRKEPVIVEERSLESMSSVERFQASLSEKMAEITRLQEANKQYPGQGFDEDAEEIKAQLHAELDTLFDKGSEVNPSQSNLA